MVEKNSFIDNQNIVISGMTNEENQTIKMGNYKTIMKKIKKALISVSDKKNLKDLLKVLTKYKIELISSGGTYKEIEKLKFKCLEVSEYTDSPEILGGRVKTLHPKIHAGILSKRNNKSHIKDLKIIILKK